MSANLALSGTMLDAACSRLKHDLRAHLTGARLPAAHLRERVDTVVRLMRSAGVPPEKMLHAVKELMQDGGLVPMGTPRRFSTGELDMLFPNMVSWCIQTYYEQDRDG